VKIETPIATCTNIAELPRLDGTRPVDCESIMQNRLTASSMVLAELPLQKIQAKAAISKAALSAHDDSNRKRSIGLRKV
jgi:hypothetical protein